MFIACLLVGKAFGNEVITPHFRFTSDSGSRGTMERVVAIAEKKRQEIFDFLDCHNEERIEVHIVSDLHSEEMQRRPEWVAGYAIPNERRVVLFAYGDEVFHAEDIFTHELAHIALHMVLGGKEIPTWFNEGLAMLFADKDLISRLETLMKAQALGGLIPLNDLDQAFRAGAPRVHLAYSEAMFFVRFLAKELGSHRLRELLSLVKDGTPFAAALLQVTNPTPRAFRPIFQDPRQEKGSTLGHFGVSIFVGWNNCFVHRGGGREKAQDKTQEEGMGDSGGTR